MEYCNMDYYGCYISTDDDNVCARCFDTSCPYNPKAGE